MRKLRAKAFSSLPLFPAKYLSTLYIFSLKGEPVIKRRVRFIYPKQNTAGFNCLSTCVVPPRNGRSCTWNELFPRRPLGEERKK